MMTLNEKWILYDMAATWFDSLNSIMSCHNNIKNCYLTALPHSLRSINQEACPTKPFEPCSQYATDCTDMDVTDFAKALLLSKALDVVQPNLQQHAACCNGTRIQFQRPWQWLLKLLSCLPAKHVYVTVCVCHVYVLLSFYYSYFAHCVLSSEWSKCEERGAQ